MSPEQKKRLYDLFMTTTRVQIKGKWHNGFGVCATGLMRENHPGFDFWDRGIAVDKRGLRIRSKEVRTEYNLDIDTLTAIARDNDAGMTFHQIAEKYFKPVE